MLNERVNTINVFITYCESNTILGHSNEQNKEKYLSSWNLLSEDTGSLKMYN